MFVTAFFMIGEKALKTSQMSKPNEIMALLY